MKKSNKIFAFIVLIFVLASMPHNVNAQWKRLKRMVQKKKVTFVLENKSKLILFNSDVQDSLVICAKKDKECDLFASMARKRRGNPYRIWVVSSQFWNDPNRQRNYLAKFFQISFIKILRFPNLKNL